MKHLTLTLCILITFAYPSYTQPDYTYTTPITPWPESFGNHRAQLFIEEAANAVLLDFEWRRADKDVSERMFLIVNAATGDTIQNINRLAVNNDHCKLQFGPIKESGTYYFYYLPYEVQTDHGFYGRDYYTKEQAPHPGWLASIKGKIPEARVTEVQSRTAFDSFYPMEVAAKQSEAAGYSEKYKSNMLLFPEERVNPIRMKRKIPVQWLSKKQGAAFTGTARPNEYYVFQIGIWAPNQTLTDIRYTFTDLKSNSATIPGSSITCFNTEGVDPYGNPFTKQLSVERGDVQPLWFGIDLAENQPAGEYRGQVAITDQSGNSQTLPVTITVSGETLSDRGDSEPWRHSRLRWLNSTLGISDAPIKPYSAVQYNNNTITLSGRSIDLHPHSPLPQQIHVADTPVLSKPIRFIIQTGSGIREIPSRLVETKTTDGSVMLRYTGEYNDLKVEAAAITEFDGWSNYTYKVTSGRNLQVTDIRLEISMHKEAAPYFMGAGMPGQQTPARFEGNWDTSALWPFDSFWMGSANGGIHCELRGSSYSGPLLNLYRPAYPESWHNGGKGGFSLKEDETGVNMTIYSGARMLKANEPVTFEFSTIITPVKEINYSSQFTDRYYHNGGQPVPTAEEVKSGVKVINVHHANELNPFINYPFLTVDKMKAFTAKWHAEGCKVKIYYTIRELTNATTEIWALRSLGNEILRDGDSGSFKTLGGYPWLREHFVTGYTPQWYHHFPDDNELGITADASVLTAIGNSRWYNYYIEGLAWLVKNLDIDGLYLDNVAYDRRILKRMRRAMDSVKAGCIIDLHSNTGFSRGPATQYTEFFPYVDKLWFGESFQYNQMTPANWLVEVSGIPFGLMGDMLHAGGNRWLGMQYGMTVRHPWLTEGVTVDPRPVWKVWDDFDITQARMIGFWEKNPPVTTANSNVKITSYVKNDALLISIGNYSDEVQAIQLDIDWEQLHIVAEEATLFMPEVTDFQPSQKIDLNSKIQIMPRKGILLLLTSE